MFASAGFVLCPHINSVNQGMPIVPIKTVRDLLLTKWCEKGHVLWNMNVQLAKILSEIVIK